MRVELHCHTSASDGLPRPDEALRRAKEIGLGALAIADHNTQAGYRAVARRAKGILLIPAIEVTCHHRGARGHVLAFGLDDIAVAKQPDALAFLDDVRTRGGVSVIAHPFRGLGYSFYHKEIWRKADAVEVLNGTTMAFRNMRAYTQARDMKKPMTSGSDAHTLRAIGSYACEIDGGSVDDVLGAIRKGRVTLPEKSTNAFRILFSGTLRKSKIYARRFAGNR